MDVIERVFPNKLLESKVRRDISVSEASVYGKPIFEVSPKSRAAEDYLLMTEEILKRF
jgi:chromosome partitioning protein